MGAAYRGDEVSSEDLTQGSWFPDLGTRAEMQESSLPLWNETSELPTHQQAIFGFHTEACRDFHSGYCQLHRAKGRASACFSYHFDSQRRRPPVDSSSGALLYWDVPCSSMAMECQCPDGDSCTFAHSRDEISYHPAKFKTRRCNGKGCRGESICCFAHSETELRSWAPDHYSYWAHSTVGRASLDCVLPGGNTDLEACPRPPRPPQVSTTRHKQRFCASYPDVAQCRRGAACAFAHSREEAARPLLSLEEEQHEPAALTENFFMHKFKTLWCPIGVQHDWQTCVYAHNYQDARRSVYIGYGPRPCPFWSKKDASLNYAQRCPLALRCPFSHGAKEQLYHPLYFRTVICRDLRAKACPRQTLCAFFHRRAERRRAPTDPTDYSLPLREENLPEQWVTDFLAPPFRDASAGGAGLLDDDGGLEALDVLSPPRYSDVLWDPYDPVKLSDMFLNSGPFALPSSHTSGLDPLSIPLNELHFLDEDYEKDVTDP